MPERTDRKLRNELLNRRSYTATLASSLDPIYFLLLVVSFLFFFFYYSIPSPISRFRREGLIDEIFEILEILETVDEN